MRTRTADEQLEAIARIKDRILINVEKMANEIPISVLSDSVTAQMDLNQLCNNLEYKIRQSKNNRVKPPKEEDYSEEDDYEDEDEG